MKNSKKLLTLLPGYTIIYLASRMRHKQHGRNNIAFGVWLSLARAPGLGPGGRKFESCHPDLQGIEGKRFEGKAGPDFSFDEIIRSMQESILSQDGMR